MTNMSELKRSTGKGQIIHTSLKDLESAESDFPSSKPTPGVLLRAVYHAGLNRIMLDLYYESPLIISPGKGEIIEADMDQADNKLREVLLSIAERCRSQGEELLLHADRLIEIASQEVIIDEIDEIKVKSKAVYMSSPVSSDSRSIHPVSAMSANEKKQGRKTGPRIKDEDLLAMLGDDEEEEEERTRRVEETGEEEETGEDETEETEEDDLSCLLEEDEED